MDENRKYELLYVAGGMVEALPIISMLESLEIDVVTLDAGAGGALAFTLGRLGRVELYVPPHRLEEAREHLNQMLGRET